MTHVTILNRRSGINEPNQTLRISVVNALKDVKWGKGSRKEKHAVIKKKGHAFGLTTITMAIKTLMNRLNC